MAGRANVNDPASAPSNKASYAQIVASSGLDEICSLSCISSYPLSARIRLKIRRTSTGCTPVKDIGSTTWKLREMVARQKEWSVGTWRPRGY